MTYLFQKSEILYRYHCPPLLQFGGCISLLLFSVAVWPLTINVQHISIARDMFYPTGIKFYWYFIYLFGLGGEIKV